MFWLRNKRKLNSNYKGPFTYGPVIQVTDGGGGGGGGGGKRGAG